METKQQNQTVVTRFVDDDAGGLRLEEPTLDQKNDKARVGHALALRREKGATGTLYHVRWPDRMMTPPIEVEGKTFNLFLLGCIYALTDNDDLIGRYQRLPAFNPEDEFVVSEAVFYLY